MQIDSRSMPNPADAYLKVDSASPRVRALNVGGHDPTRGGWRVVVIETRTIRDAARRPRSSAVEAPRSVLRFGIGVAGTRPLAVLGGVGDPVAAARRCDVPVGGHPSDEKCQVNGKVFLDE